jgi:SP family facilitated glucose transporter-like MFS transporter 8
MVVTFALGGLAGGSCGGQLARWLGRRGTLLYNNVTFLLAAAVLGLAYDFLTLNIGRFVVGVACGVTMSATAMYLAEISPNRKSAYNKSILNGRHNLNTITHLR